MTQGLLLDFRVVVVVVILLTLAVKTDPWVIQNNIKYHTSNGSWCMGIKGEMSGTVYVTFIWDMYTYVSCL